MLGHHGLPHFFTLNIFMTIESINIGPLFQSMGYGQFAVHIRMMDRARDFTLEEVMEKILEAQDHELQGKVKRAKISLVELSTIPYDVEHLISLLRQHGYSIHLEVSGHMYHNVYSFAEYIIAVIQKPHKFIFPINELIYMARKKDILEDPTIAPNTQVPVMSLLTTKPRNEVINFIAGSRYTWGVLSTSSKFTMDLMEEGVEQV